MKPLSLAERDDTCPSVSLGRVSSEDQARRAAFGGVVLVANTLAYCFGWAHVMLFLGAFGGSIAIFFVGSPLAGALVIATLTCGGKAVASGRGPLRWLGIALILVAFVAPYGGCVAGWRNAAKMKGERDTNASAF